MLCFISIGDFSSENYNNDRIGLISVVIILGGLVYLGKDSIGGRSIGKRILGIMVRDREDHELVPSVKRLFQRNLTLIIWPFEYFELSNNPNEPRRGDRIAKTIVLQNPVRPKTIKLILFAIGIFVSIIIGILFLISSLFLNSEPYKISIQAIESDEQIQTEIGNIKGYGLIPTGSINVTNGEGNANLCITVKGSIKNKSVCTELKKSKNGKWKLIKME